MMQEGFEAGQGTYLSEDKKICASFVGVKRLRPEPGSQRQIVEVVQAKPPAFTPSPGDIVTVKVTRINQRLASADILCVGTQPLEETFTGIIRLQDVRATEVDKVELSASFRPGDIVRAEVASLGSSRDYYLSTARNELGVVYARSLAGIPMVPVSWQEMQCPVTKATECRKVAKISN